MSTVPTHLRFGSVQVDLQRREVQRPEGKVVGLTPIEHDLLVYLVEHAGRVLPHRELLAEVWGYADGVQSRTLYSTVGRLRLKIEPEPAHPVFLVSLPRTGYRLDLPEAPAGLPALPELLGRQIELAELLARLGSGARQLTLLGPGGMGKTSLALGAAHALARRGVAVHWVDLAHATEPSEVKLAVSRALALDPRPGQAQGSLTEGLAEGGPMLLCLDRVEQLGPPLAQELTGWLEGAPRLQILATSRVPVGGKDEQLCTLGPLDEAASSRLFLDRATRAGGRPGRLERASLGEIVAEAHGNPLVIELAAAQADTLSFPAIARQLRRGLDTLAEGRLMAMVQSTWDLLTEEQRDFLVSCATFSGGFTTEAAGVVAELPGEAAPLVRTLLRRSLAWKRREAGGPRIHLYDAVAAFALDQRDRIEAARLRHLAWALGLCTTVSTRPPSPLVPELANLLAAAALARSRDPASAFTINHSIEIMLATQAAPDLRARVLDAMLEGAPDAAHRCRVLRRRSAARRRQGDFAGSDADLVAALEVARAAELPEEVARIRSRQGAQLVVQERHDEARTVLEDALQVAGLAGLRDLEAYALLFIGESWRMQGEPRKALEPLGRVAALYRSLEDLQALSNCLPSLAGAAWLSGQTGRAAALLAEAEVLLETTEDPNGRLMLCLQRMDMALSRGDLGEGRRFIDQARQLCRQTGRAQTSAFIDEGEAWLAWLSGAPDRATDWFHRAEAGYESWGNDRACRRARTHRLLLEPDPSRLDRLDLLREGARDRGDPYTDALLTIHLALLRDEPEGWRELETLQPPMQLAPLRHLALAQVARSQGDQARAEDLTRIALAPGGPLTVDLQVLRLRLAPGTAVEVL